MLKITICDDEEIIVHYVEKLIQESIDENVKIYKYTDAKKLKADNEKEKLKDIDISNNSNLFIIKTFEKR